MLIEHLIDEADTAIIADFTVGDLDAFYKQARLKFDDDESFKARERERVVKLQGRRDPQTTALWSVLVAESTRHFNELYAKLGILLTDEDLAGESTYQSLMPDVLTRPESEGLLIESDGARVVFVPGFTNQEGAPLPLIVQARAGGGGDGRLAAATCAARTRQLRPRPRRQPQTPAQPQRSSVAFTRSTRSMTQARSLVA